jgi:hypothetical protein
MEKTISFISLIVPLFLLGLMTACQTTAVGPGGTPQKETLLAQSGFRPFTVTTPKQQQRVSALPAGKVSLVGYKGKSYYVYPTATKDRILVGQSDAVQCLQTGACGIRSDDESGFRGRNTRPPSRSRSAIRRIRSARRVMTRFERLGT